MAAQDPTDPQHSSGWSTSKTITVVFVCAISISIIYRLLVWYNRRQTLRALHQQQQQQINNNIAVHQSTQNYLHGPSPTTGYTQPSRTNSANPNPYSYSRSTPPPPPPFSPAPPSFASEPPLVSPLQSPLHMGRQQSPGAQQRQQQQETPHILAPTPTFPTPMLDPHINVVVPNRNPYTNPYLPPTGSGMGSSPSSAPRTNQSQSTPSSPPTAAPTSTSAAIPPASYRPGARVTSPAPSSTRTRTPPPMFEEFPHSSPAQSGSRQEGQQSDARQMRPILEETQRGIELSVEVPPPAYTPHA